MTPFNFCTSGATVFAPGVNLTDFSATYNATYVPKASGEVIFDVYSFGKGRLLVNQKEAMSFYNSHGGNKQSYALQVEAYVCGVCVYVCVSACVRVCACV